MKLQIKDDWIILSPLDIDLSYSPVRQDISEETYVLGAFNPGFVKLPNGNYLLMVRIAEALKNNQSNNSAFSLRWDVSDRFVIDKIPISDLDKSDPRKYLIKIYPFTKVYVLTSLSWLLPVEISADCKIVIKIHYDKIISPSKEYQEYGVEDARITKIGSLYYMTVCSVGSSRQSTTLYISEDGLNYKLDGMIPISSSTRIKIWCFSLKR